MAYAEKKLHIHELIYVYVLLLTFGVCCVEPLNCAVKEFGSYWKCAESSVQSIEGCE
jgi:hypothetical protein